MAGVDPSQFLFARALALHQAGRHAESWSDLVAANRIQRQAHAETWRSTRVSLAASVEYARTHSAAEGPPARRPDHPGSLFILGPSRSGKSTLERLLLALPGVVRGYESPIVQDAARKAAERGGRPYQPDEFRRRLPAGVEGEFLQGYTATLKQRAAGSHLFTNTNPATTSMIFDIAEHVPKAFFVFLRRNEQDLALRIFMKLYRGGNYFSYDLNWIMEYLNCYNSIVESFVESYPGISRVVSYEEVIEDPDRAIGTVAQLCGIQSDPKPLPPVGDDRGVSTPYWPFMREALDG